MFSIVDSYSCFVEACEKREFERAKTIFLQTPNMYVDRTRKGCYKIAKDLHYHELLNWIDSVKRDENLVRVFD